jgi:hypothetical protein
MASKPKMGRMAVLKAKRLLIEIAAGKNPAA